MKNTNIFFARVRRLCAIALLICFASMPLVVRSSELSEAERKERTEKFWEKHLEENRVSILSFLQKGYSFNIAAWLLFLLPILIMFLPAPLLLKLSYRYENLRKAAYRYIQLSTSALLFFFMASSCGGCLNSIAVPADASISLESGMPLEMLKYLIATDIMLATAYISFILFFGFYMYLLGTGLVRLVFRHDPGFGRPIEWRPFTDLPVLLPEKTGGAGQTEDDDFHADNDD